MPWLDSTECELEGSWLVGRHICALMPVPNCKLELLHLLFTSFFSLDALDFSPSSHHAAGCALARAGHGQWRNL